MLAAFLICAGLVWYGGGRLGLPAALRATLIGGLYLALLGLLLVRPGGYGIGWRGWLILGAAGGLGVLYAAGVRRLHARAKPAAAEPGPAGTFRPVELERYSRHFLMHEIGGPGQKKIRNARVLVVGAGGLGAPSLMYLAAAGVGTIGIVDDDVVENSNLQRQIIHADAMLGRAKVESAAAAMRAQNPYVEVRPYNMRLDEAGAARLFADYDLILDGTDNFATRYMINRVAAGLGKPVIAAAITQWEGQISLYDPARGAPCYQCVFPEAPAAGMVPSCAEAGVASPLPGVLGALMALETIKEITGAGQGLRGRLFIYDGLYTDARVLQTEPRDDCPVCSALRKPG